MASKPDWLYDKSPLGKIPALELENGDVLYESLIICDYLDERYPQNPLHSTDPLQKAKDRLLIEQFSKVSKPDAVSFIFGFINGLFIFVVCSPYVNIFIWKIRSYIIVIFIHNKWSLLSPQPPLLLLNFLINTLLFTIRNLSGYKCSRAFFKVRCILKIINPDSQLFFMWCTPLEMLHGNNRIFNNKILPFSRVEGSGC